MATVYKHHLTVAVQAFIAFTSVAARRFTFYVFLINNKHAVDL